ncbi:MAG: hypothetical protein PF549_01780, partial [Patescibacteria group bacterium]|nr:hypothetical protein [Patescibacteria group bacterium]
MFVLGVKGVQAEFYESTFTSQVFNNFHSSVDYGVMNWNADIPLNTSLVFSVRAGNVSDLSAVSWDVISSSGDSLDAYDGMRYMQYSVVLGTDDLSVTPTVYDVAMTKNTTELVSSVFDSQDSKNIINGISWDETLAGSSNVVFQIRSSANNSTWTSWVGPDGTTESWFSDPNGGETSGAGFRDQVSDRYYQYRAILISNIVGGTEWPTVDNVNVDYELPDMATRAYESSFVSSIKDAGTAQEYLNIVWNADVPPNTSLSVKVRTDSNADMSGATAWASCDLVSNNTDISSNNCVTDGDEYFEYQVTLGTDDLSITPTLYDITVYALLPGGVISSPYDSTDAANAIGGVVWTEDATLPSGSQTKIYLRSGADTTALASASWTEIASSTPSSLTTGCGKVGQIVTCDNTTATVIPLSMQDGIGDRYFQYKMELSSSGASFPTVEQMQVIYVVNALPEFQTTATAVPNSTGDVDISYSVRDPDTETSTVTPSFQYSLNAGSTWTAITSGCLGASDLVAKAVETVNYTAHTAVWDPSCETGISTTTHEIDAQVRVTVNDGQAANNTATSDSINFTLDTTPPALGTNPILVDASQDPAELTLDATDNSTFYQRISQGADQTECDTNLSALSYTDEYNATPTIDLTQDPSIICVQFQDQFQNQSTISYITTPETPQGFMIQDTSNMLTNPKEYRLFIAWQEVTATTPAFFEYQIYRSESETSGYTELITIDDIALNYHGDNTTTLETDYYYKVRHQDEDGNISFFTNPIHANANGIQDAGEGGGGSSAIPPEIYDVEIPTESIFTTQATIQWDTDEISNSTVEYITETGGDFTDASSQGLSSMRDRETDDDTDENGVGLMGQHQIILTNLTPNTTYYLQLKSTDPTGNTGEDKQGTDGYTFTTLDGPTITDVTVPPNSIFNETVTVTWNTDIDADSYVTYADNAGFTDAVMTGIDTPTQAHTIELTGLTPGATYYFYVDSNEARDTNEPTGYYTFTTSSDLVAPTITFNPAEDITNLTDISARVSWVTDELSFSQIEYGTTTSYGTTLSNPNLNSNHIFNLTSLTKGTTYYFKLTSADNSANTTEETGSFATTDTTDYVAPVITFNPAEDITNLTDTSARINWTTDEVALSQIEYGTDTSYGTTLNNTNYNTSHSFDLTGLIKGTTYYFKLVSTDASSNTATDDNSTNGYTFKTSDSTDYDPPVITFDGRVTSLSETSVQITWDTDELANSQIDYGENSSLDQTLTNSNYNTNHSFILTGLTKGDTYYFQIQNTDTGGNPATDDNGGSLYSFTTEDLTDYDDPIITFDPLTDISNLTNTSARVSWTTNEITISQLEYGTDTSYGTTLTNPNLNSNHIFNFTGLTKDTTYYFKLNSTDQASNTTEDDNGGSGYTFTTTDSSDYDAPVITFNPTTDITNLTDTSVRVSWITNESATSRIDYGTNALSLDQDDTNTNYNFNHSFDLINLSPSTTYYFQLQNTDASSNPATDDNGGNYYTFTTSAEGDSEGPEISGVTVSNISYNSATIEWETGEEGNSLVDYGTEKGIYDMGESNISEESTTSHSVVLETLDSLTQYFFKVISLDSNNNKSEDDNSSQGYTFTTLSGATDTDTDGTGDQLQNITAEIQTMLDTYEFTEAEIQAALSGLYNISITSNGPSVSITGT